MNMTKEIAEKILEIERKREEVMDALKDQIPAGLFEDFSWDNICKEATRFLLKGMGAIS